MPSLGNDIATLREKKDLSIEDVQHSTKIPPHILRSIEDDSIFDNMQNNVTYTRSYVRSYAKAVGVKEADIVQALDRVEEGTYDGSILSDADRNQQDHSDAEERQNETDEETTEKEQTVKKEKKDKPKDKKGTPVSSKATKSKSDNWDWVQVGRQSKTETSRSKGTGLLIILILIAAIAAGFVIYIYYYAESEPPETEPSSTEIQQPTTPSDSLQGALLSDENQPQMQNNTPTGSDGTLADTLTIGIYAASGNLEPVRIYTDILGQQNPYWVLQGDTIRLNFVNTVRIRAANQYQQLQILFNGHIVQNYYQEYYNSESGMVELDRSVFENHPEWLQPIE